MSEQSVCDLDRFVAMACLPAVAEVSNIKRRMPTELESLRDILQCEAWIQKSHHMALNDVPFSARSAARVAAIAFATRNAL